MRKDLKFLDNTIERIKNLPAEEINKMSKDLNNYVINFSLSRDYNISKVNIKKYLWMYSEDIVKIKYSVLGVDLFGEEIEILNDFDENDYDGLLIYLSENNFIINRFIDDTTVD